MGTAGVEIVAHRGLHDGAPENSHQAVVAAIEAGLRFIEVDVRATGDGRLVALHDARVDRTTDGTGPLRGKRGQEASRLRLRDGSALPRLEELIEICRGRARLCIDVKERDLGPAVATVVREMGADAEIWSSHAEVIARAADAGLDAALISLGVFPRGGVPALADLAAQLGAIAVSFFPADIGAATVRACGERNLGLMCGTPNDRPTWRRLAAHRARAVITDDPMGARQTLASAPVSTYGVAEDG